jgi:hypothetical protein
LPRVMPGSCREWVGERNGRKSRGTGLGEGRENNCFRYFRRSAEIIIEDKFHEKSVYRMNIWND